MLEIRPTGPDARLTWARLRRWYDAASSDFPAMPAGPAAPYHQGVKRLAAAPPPAPGPATSLAEVPAAEASPVEVSAAARSVVSAVARLPPWVQDLPLALALTAISVATLVPYRSSLHPFWLAAVLVVAETLPLAGRRWHPVVAITLTGAARVAYDLVGLTFAPLPLGPAIAFFTVIDQCRPVIRRVTVAVTLAAIVISQLSPGHHEPYDFTVAAMLFATAWIAGVLNRTRRAYTRAYLAQMEVRAAQAEAEADAQTARAAATERTRIARELHDVVAHHVSLMAVQAEAASSLLPQRPAEAERSVHIIGTTARQALAELRRLLTVLRGPGEGAQTAPPASLADIGAVLDQVRATGLAVDYAVQGTVCPLGPGTELTAYRIIQEALTNTIRHSSAASAIVNVCYEPGFVTVRVTDSPEGRPAAPRPTGPHAAGPHAAGLPMAADVPASSGFGLAGIAERVASCGGTLAIGPTGSDGFAVTARLPAA
jgi:signal transduction histidine kinase